MARLRLWFDLRAGPDSVLHRELYAAALEHCRWVDGLGGELVTFGEHHGTDDGYLPSPVTMAAAAAAATRGLRVRPVVVAPLHDPVALAEQLAVVDLVSGGRLTVVVLAGYVASEFAAAGRSLDGRQAALGECIRVLDAAWTGSTFPFEGRTVRVRPVPVQQPRPPIVLGGSTPVSARLAATLADDYYPTKPGLWERYRVERSKLGLADPGPWPRFGPTFLHLSRDPAAAWEVLLPHLLHGVNGYAAQLGRPMVGAEALRRSPAFRVVHPDEAGPLVDGLGTDGILELRPLFGGVPPAEAERSLSLLSDVLD